MAITNANMRPQESHAIEWATPWDLYNLLDSKFKFTLDPCATMENHKCAKFFTKEQNGLEQSWENERVFCNPPYGSQISEWVAKAWSECLHNNVFVVMLLPPRTDTNWFHEYASWTSEIWFLKGRVKFQNPINPGQSPQDPSCLLIFDNSNRQWPRVRFWDWKTEIETSQRRESVE